MDMENPGYRLVAAQAVRREILELASGAAIAPELTPLLDEFFKQVLAAGLAGGIESVVEALEDSPHHQFSRDDLVSSLREQAEGIQGIGGIPGFA